MMPSENEDETSVELFTKKVCESILEILKEHKDIHVVSVIGFQCGSCEGMHLAVEASDGENGHVYGDKRGYEILEFIQMVIDREYKKDDGVGYHG